jgi:hypothetical protein
LSIPNTADTYGGSTVFQTSTISAVPVNGTWIDYKVTAVVPATAIRGLLIQVYRDSGVVNTTTTTEFSQMQILEGDIDSVDYAYFSRSFTQELLACQRYYVQTNPTTADYKSGGGQYPLLAGVATGNQNFQFPIKLPNEMRVLPVFTVSTGGLSSNIVDGGTAALAISKDSFTARVTSTGAGGWSTGFPFIANAEI